MSGDEKTRSRARNPGAGVLLLVLFVGLVVLAGIRAGWFRERRLVLATVADGSELMEGSPVYFRGVEIGEVLKINAPSRDFPGFRLRMAVDKTAWKHIPLDSPVRIDRGRMNLPFQVTILPGKEAADWDFPGKVKVLREVSDEEDAVRLIRDVLDGLEDLSRAKATEADMLELRNEVKQLRRQLEILNAEKALHDGEGRGVRDGSTTAQ